MERNRCIHSALLRALRRQTSQRRWCFVCTPLLVTSRVKASGSVSSRQQLPVALLAQRTHFLLRVSIVIRIPPRVRRQTSQRRWCLVCPPPLPDLAHGPTLHRATNGEAPIRRN